MPQPARTATADDAPPVWRVRVRMHDHPGTLARLAIRLADLECNILGLTVLPVPGGVLDEIVLRPATGLPRGHLVAAIRAEGCECTAVIDADVHDLVDPASSTLLAARRAIDDPARLADVLKDALAADVVTRVPAAEANPGRTESGHRAVFGPVAGIALVARRRWAPFVQLELTRAEALLGLLTAAARNLAGPVVLDRPDGAAIVLRRGVPADAGAVSDLHRRCSTATLFRRYHSGVRTVPRRWLHRLLVPPRGTSVLAVFGRDVIGLGQLIGAEISLLVEDTWQRQGIGTALLARLAVLAEADGVTELKADCLPGDEVLARTAARAGLRTERGAADGTRLRLVLPG
ncbi:GNAT family N-acetyltransferase [Amycolatopsis sp. OK19-0408]|uniref:GNAT family N-acetyltransferase n=1 Tax=Amycolatopsis iheyensis TaxID=2945988 RepID=A0A9X2NK95_9PSEU|nr:GNAT family N-acetyltransferase [Amycolatopsis iheyensis]MCR6488119.1 GNAT family N-acetyltransferase [Amycolatopsis iheyensis]